MTRRLLAGAALAAVLAAVTAVPAAACGGLVAPNGAVRLAQATTFVAWKDGVEHYTTSFAYQGDVPQLGWIVPLPAVPDRVEEAGAWTLQRLEREAHPPPPFRAEAAPVAAQGAPAEVLQKTRIEALDITVLRGSGQAVVRWCTQNAFTLPDETRAHILAYASTSPIFMAARYDVNAARQHGQFQGDGTPVLITMRTPRLWVPLEVLANANDPTVADLFLLTDQRPSSASTQIAPGFTLQLQEQMSPQLQHDLASDRNMGWVPQTGWLSYLALSAPGRSVTYDMTVSPAGAMRLAAMGAGPAAAPPPVVRPQTAAPAPPAPAPPPATVPAPPPAPAAAATVPVLRFTAVTPPTAGGEAGGREVVLVTASLAVAALAAAALVTRRRRAGPG
ncbi:MAG TPA: DUF2330 domain-containing protein [Candidatus Dormibacteraeota bacterium]